MMDINLQVPVTLKYVCTEVCMYWSMCIQRYVDTEAFYYEERQIMIK